MIITTMFVDDVTMDVCVETSQLNRSPEPHPELRNASAITALKPMRAAIDHNLLSGLLTANPNTRARSMRNGIIRTKHNRYGFSDAYGGRHPDTAGGATLTYICPISEAADQDVRACVGLRRLDRHPLWGHCDQEVWTFGEFDMNLYKGTTIRRLAFNNGLNDTTACTWTT
jgi:hypothetical protein